MANQKKILVIDDDETLCEMYAERLKASNFQVEKAFDGKEGLKKAGETAPDLILLDIMMPKMDGYEVYKALKSSERLKKIPIILLTALTKDEKKVGMLESLTKEKVEYISKSKVMPGEIVKRITQRLGQ